MGKDLTQNIQNIQNKKGVPTKVVSGSEISNSGQSSVSGGKTVKRVTAKVANKNEFNWSYKTIAQKDLNTNLWPFKYVRNEGKATKMECRSLSALKKSFEGTPYNFNDCPRVLSRYSILMKVFKEKYANDVPRITHLFITFDSVYFMTDNDGKVKGGNYGTSLCSTENVKRIICGFDISNKMTENTIAQLFDAYKKTKDNNIAMKLRGCVDYYIKARKHMMVLDNYKNFIDIFKSAELNFSSLKYLIFSPTPNNSFDYRLCITQGINALGYGLNQDILNEFEKIPSLEGEVRVFRDFAKSNPQMNIKSIRKIYEFNSSIALNRDNIREVFKACGNNNYTQGLLFQAELTAHEKAEINKKIAELKQQSGEDTIDESKAKFIQDIKEIGSIISNIDIILNKGLDCYNKAGLADRDSFADNFRLESIRRGIQGEYDYKNQNKTIVGSDILAIMPFIELGNKLDADLVELGLAEKTRFYQIIPTYFKDERKTEKSMGIGFDTVEKAEKSVKDLKRLKRQMIDLFEAFIGIQYGMLSVYLKRFGRQGVDAALLLLPLIKDENRPLVYSRNVLSIAERYLYSSLGLSLNKEADNFYDSEKGQIVIGVFKSFCKEAIDIVNGRDTVALTHSEAAGLTEQMKEKIKNLIEQYKCVVFMYEAYYQYFGLDK